MRTLAAAIVLALAAAAPVRGGSEVETLVRGNTAFALDLYQRLAAGEGNLFLSPYSISTALGMTLAGARGVTAREMSDTLHFTLGQERLHPAFSELEGQLEAIQEAGDVELAVANALWPQAGYDFLPEYLALVREQYRGEATPVDYIAAAEPARVTINEWVESRTRNRIRDIIPPGLLNAATRLVLVNAIYFKGAWQERFEADATQPLPFHVNSSTSIEVPTMAKEGTFGWAEDEDVQVLELPYRGGSLSMFVLLPRERDGLAVLERRLSAKQLDAWRGDLKRRELIVLLPRFKMTSSFELKPVLSALGMREAFSDSKADFSGMDGRTDGLFIGQVLHKAFVEVNEEGTEAAASTAVTMQLRAAPVPTPEFRADHPFLFLVQDRRTGSILFLGRVADPSSQGR